MSIEAMVWALKHAPAEDQTERLVLITLADHAHADGTAAWPAIATIADTVGVSTDTVKRRLKNLAARRIILPGDQRHVEFIPANRQPRVWNLNLKMTKTNTQGVHSSAPSDHARGCTALPPQDTSGGAQPCTPSEPLGVHSSAPSRGCTALHPKPSKEPSIEITPLPPTPTTPTPAPQGDTPGAHAPTVIDHDPTPLTEPATTHTGTYPADFEQWWDIYPRKVGKPGAFAAWRYATRGPQPRATPAQLIAAATVYAKSREGQPPRYTKNPEGWLRDRRWEDNPTTYAPQNNPRNAFLAQLTQFPKEIP